MKKYKYTIGIIGCGNMGEAIIKGIIRTGFIRPDKITYYDKKNSRCSYIKDQYNACFSGSLDNLVKTSKYMLVAVKPQDILYLIEELKESIGNDGKSRIISIAAGVSTTVFENFLGNKSSVIRIMPNTPALVNMGISAISRGRFVSDDDFDFTVGVIKALGDYVVVDEDLQNTVTAISGSGPAYFFLFCKYLIEFARERGIEKKDAERLAIKTMEGAAAMLDRMNTDTDSLIDMVTSPGGTTEQAILQFKKKDFKKVIYSAVKSAEARANQIQKELEVGK